MSFNLLDLTKSSEEIVTEVNPESSKSYFISALEQSKEINEIYRNASDKLYSSLQEGSSIGKAFDSFFDAMTDVINQFDSAIGKTSSDFVSELIHRANQDTFIIKNKDLFLHYPSNKGFIMTRYKFKNLDNDIPKSEACVEFEKEYDKIDKILTNRYTSNQQKITELIYEYNSFLSEISNGFYDYYRGKILGMESTRIRKGEYSEFLFYVFRDREKIKNVSSDHIKQAYFRASNIKQQAEYVNKEKKKVAKEYDTIKKNMQNIRFDRLVATFGPDSPQLEAKFDTYIKVKTDQIVNMCNIHLLAYNAKLDAIASCYLQDRSMLLSAMNKATEPNNEFDVEKNDLGGDI